MNAIESTEHYKGRIKAELNNTLTNTDLAKGTKKTGKVRDQYELDDQIVLITTLLESCDYKFYTPNFQDFLLIVFLNCTFKFALRDLIVAIDIAYFTAVAFSILINFCPFGH